MTFVCVYKRQWWLLYQLLDFVFERVHFDQDINMHIYKTGYSRIWPLHRGKCNCHITMIHSEPVFVDLKMEGATVRGNFRAPTAFLKFLLFNLGDRLLNVTMDHLIWKPAEIILHALYNFIGTTEPWGLDEEIFCVIIFFSLIFLCHVEGKNFSALRKACSPQANNVRLVMREWKRNSWSRQVFYMHREWQNFPLSDWFLTAYAMTIIVKNSSQSLHSTALIFIEQPLMPHPIYVYQRPR